MVAVAHILIIHGVVARVLAGGDGVGPGLAVQTVLYLGVALGQRGGSCHQRLVGVVRHKVSLCGGLLRIGGRARGLADADGFTAADNVGIVVAGNDVEVHGVLTRVGIGGGGGAACRGVVLGGQRLGSIVHGCAGAAHIHGDAVGRAVIRAGIAGGCHGKAGLGDGVLAACDSGGIVGVFVPAHGDRILAHVGGLGRRGVQRYTQLVPGLVRAADGIGQCFKIRAEFAALVVGGDGDGGLVDGEVCAGVADRVVISGGKRTLPDGIGSGVLARLAGQLAGQRIEPRRSR